MAFLNPLPLPTRASRPCATRPRARPRVPAASLAHSLNALSAAALNALSPVHARLLSNLAHPPTLLASSQTKSATSTGIFSRLVPRETAPKPAPKKSSTALSTRSDPLHLFKNTQPERKESTSFVTAAVRSVGTSVVRIDTERVIQPTTIPGLDPLLEDPALRKLFPEPKPRLERGLGSGFIISADGYLLTNAHVVRGAQKVTVTLTDGRSFEGTVKGSDEFLDLAVVKVDPDGKQLPVAPLGASKDLEVGDWVIAVGNPVGLDNTVTLGIVSSLNRSSSEVGIPEKRLNLIQTSASLNPGSSGGPICNQWGEVVGISTAVRANAEAIGFAIPIDIAKDVASELARGNTIAHAFVGIKMASITPDLARQNNKDPNSLGIVPEVDGALVVRVVPKSPAAEGGVRRNDVIVGIDGQTVRSAKDVQAIVDRSRVGQVVSMKVLRGDGSAPIDIGVKTGNLSALKREYLKDGGIDPRLDPRQ